MWTVRLESGDYQSDVAFIYGTDESTRPAPSQEPTIVEAEDKEQKAIAKWKKTFATA